MLDSETVTRVKHKGITYLVIQDSNNKEAFKVFSNKGDKVLSSFKAPSLLSAKEKAKSKLKNKFP